MDASELVMARRSPVQDRSRERVRRILSTAAAIIAERGSDQLKMSEIAVGSEMSLGALYRYFPDKAAIIRTLAEQYNADSRSCIAAAFSEVDDIGSLESSFRSLMIQYLGIVRSEPVMRDIWSGMQADKELATQQRRETEVCAALLQDAILKAHRSLDPIIAKRLSLLVWELGEAAVRLSLTVPQDDGDAIVDAYIRMALRELHRPA